jgi:hypothetical protein
VPAGSGIRARTASVVPGGAPTALEVRLPASSIDLATMLFSIPWLAITGTWTYGAWNAANPLFASFSIPFWAVGFNMVHSGATSALESTRLFVGPERFYLEKTVLDHRMFYIHGDTRELSKVATETYGYVNGHPQTNLVLHHGIKSYALRSGLHPAENAFVARVVTDFLKNHQKTKHHHHDDAPHLTMDTSTPLFAKARL